MDDFSVFNFPEQGSSSRRVYYQGTGPAVIVMHELPGMIPECVDLARRIAAAGFTVYLPLLFGEPDRSFSLVSMIGYTAQICISREFYCFAKHQSSPITNWLRDLCRKVHQDCDDRGVGVIGMCLTGGFVLSLMADESVIAPVISQPSLPLGITPAHKAALGVSEPELNRARLRDVPLLALRFSDDKTSPRQRWEALQRAFGEPSETLQDDQTLCWKRGDKLETIEIKSDPGNPFKIPQRAHAVLTLEYRNQADHPTYLAFQRVVEFLQEQFVKQ